MCTDRFPRYSGVDNLDVMMEAKNYNRHLVQLITSYAKSTRSLVDFGAGSGTFARAISEQGYEVVCVEPDSYLRKKLTSEGLTVHSDIAELPKMASDFIYTLNVLEHIENDHQALLQLFATLRPGGRLLVYVPAFAILYTSMDRKVGHYRRYSRHSLVGALHQAGFQIDDARYVDCMGFLATLLYRLTDNKEGDINLSALKLYDRLAFPVSRALDRSFSKWFGKNLLVYARRPEGAPRSSYV
jgi:SAM-dependent methyltransferase